MFDSISWPEDQRLYAKDVECPPEWVTWLQTDNTLPEQVRPQGSTDLLRYVDATVIKLSQTGSMPFANLPLLCDRSGPRR